MVTADPIFGSLLLGRRENALGDPSNGILMSDSVKLERPSVSGDGSAAVYVSASADICVLPTNDPLQGQCLGLDGAIHSAAISPDGKLGAFVVNDPATGQVDNRITLYEFATDKTKTYNQVAPVLDGSPVDNVLYADALVFSSDSKQLIYDAVSQIHFGGGAAVTRWSIFSINLATDSTTVLVPPLELADFGNPNIGRAGNRYLTFDARSSVNGTTFILVLDLFTGEFGQVGTVGTGFGYPTFTGDESAIIYAQQDFSAFATGFSLVKQPLTANRLAPVGEPTLWYSDATLGVIYRRGTFVGGNQPPATVLTSPQNGATFAPGAAITINAEAGDPEGPVAAVEFYDGSDKLGEDTQAPYTFTWNNAPAGVHRLIARARDELGAVTDSAAVTVTVGSISTPARLSVGIQAGRVRIQLKADPGSYAIEHSPDLRTWTERFSVTADAAGNATVEDAAGDRARFYRARRR
jgi:hypothetical protein